MSDNLKTAKIYSKTAKNGSKIENISKISENFDLKNENFNLKNEKSDFNNVTENKDKINAVSSGRANEDKSSGATSSSRASGGEVVSLGSETNGEAVSSVRANEDKSSRATSSSRASGGEVVSLGRASSGEAVDLNGEYVNPTGANESGSETNGEVIKAKSSSRASGGEVVSSVRANDDKSSSATSSSRASGGEVVSLGRANDDKEISATSSSRANDDKSSGATSSSRASGGEANRVNMSVGGEAVDLNGEYVNPTGANESGSETSGEASRSTQAEKYTLITGACGGLGRAFAQQCVRAGENIIIAGRSKESLEALKKELLAEFQTAKIITQVLDLLNTENIIDLMHKIAQKNIYIAKLINNAGAIVEGDFEKMTDAEVKEVVEVNCIGTLSLTKQVLNNRKKNQKVEILTVASLAGFYPIAHMAIYSASKAFLISIMTALSVEYSGKNVVFCTVCPGGIPTNNQMKESIASMGLGGRLSAQSPAKVAKIALRALKKKKTIIVTGTFNKFLAVLSKIFPRKFLAKSSGKIYKKSQQKRGF